MDEGTHQNKHLDLQRRLVANAQPLFRAMGNDDDANDDANNMSDVFYGLQLVFPHHPVVDNG